MVYAQPSTFLENNTHKLLWDFDIHMDHLISARRPDLIIRELPKLWTAALADHRIKLKEGKRGISISTLLGN